MLCESSIKIVLLLKYYRYSDKIFTVAVRNVKLMLLKRIDIDIDRGQTTDCVI